MRSVFIIFVILAPTLQIYEESLPKSTCPSIFEYEPNPMEPGRWYGVVHLTTDITLHSLWLNIVLDKKANLLANWLGEVTTRDNTDYKIENTEVKIEPGTPLDVRFFVQYNKNDPPPKMEEIWLNGRLICNGTAPVVLKEIPVVRIEKQSKIPNSLPLKLEPRLWTTAKPSGLTESPRTNIDPTVDDYENENSSDDDYYILGPNNIVLSETEQCGQVPINSDSIVSSDSSILEGQWPWQIALHHNKLHSIYKYICSGTLISRQHVITAAHCVTRNLTKNTVDKSTLTVYLGRQNLRTVDDGVQIELVHEIIIHPNYDPSTFLNDLSILKLRNSISFTDWVQPVCLWPEDDEQEFNIIGKIGSVAGWGFDETGLASETLTLSKMPVVDTETCLRSKREFFKKHTSQTTYCASYEQDIKICNGDGGTGMLFKRDGLWYLRGLVAVSVITNRDELRCNSNYYVVFTDLANFLPWIKETIK